MRKIKVVVLLFRQLQHGFTKNAKVSPNLTVAQIALNYLGGAARREPNFCVHVDPQASHDCRSRPNIQPTSQTMTRTGEIVTTTYSQTETPV